MILGASTIDSVVFAISAAIVLAGAFGVITSRNPVYCALSLVLTLFGVAVLFVEQEAQFLAAVQVVVYAGAIVVLFLFVIMLLGVDRIDTRPGTRMRFQGPLAFLVGLAALVELLALARLHHWATGASSGSTSPATHGIGNTSALARSLFTTYLLPFELTSLLLIIAVLAAVVLARRPSHPPAAPPPVIESLDPGAPLAPPPGIEGPSTEEVTAGVRNVTDEEVGKV
ncbi:MAG TPA: NADH-quinone oxidoreductase subunit J [Acidimicrobiales bacterium]|nr:NADH-quinone oxidoreductase subunit J [Acidimicrobiales bacterium]